MSSISRTVRLDSIELGCDGEQYTLVVNLDDGGMVAIVLPVAGDLNQVTSRFNMIASFLESKTAYEDAKRGPIVCQ